MLDFSRLSLYGSEADIDPTRVKSDMVVGHYTNKDGRLVVGRVVPREGEPNWSTVERRIERVNEAQKAADIPKQLPPKQGGFFMAMNKNEGGSAYPPNPDVKSGSCLIAGFHALTDIRPSYWNA